MILSTVEIGFRKTPMWNNIQTIACQIYYKSECV